MPGKGSNSTALLKTSIPCPSSAHSIPRAKHDPMAKTLSFGCNLNPGEMAGVKSASQRRWRASVPFNSVGNAPFWSHRLYALTKLRRASVVVRGLAISIRQLGRVELFLVFRKEVGLPQVKSEGVRFVGG